MSQIRSWSARIECLFSRTMSESSDTERRIREIEDQIERLKFEKETLVENLVKAERKERDKYTRNDSDSFSALEIERYSRQLLVSNGLGGIEGQKKILKGSVLIIGAGGIGSTAIPYLAAAGVGNISIVDFDTVDVSNLHRQVIHKTSNVGLNKAISACLAVRDLNPLVETIPCTDMLSAQNVMDLVKGQDCVIDCSDNPKTRYLVNDACVLLDVPLVSASAIGTEGQVTVYHYRDGPCYRCLYPKESVTAGCKACTDLGVLGPVPGLMGLLQATEALKILTYTGDVLHDRLLMYDSMSCSFTSIKKPGRRKNCPVCGEMPKIKSIADSDASTVFAAGPNQSFSPPDLDASLEVTCSEFSSLRDQGKDHILLDVRVRHQYDICHLPNSVHIPLSELPTKLPLVESLSDGKPIFCLCRRGIDSIEATRIIVAAKVIYPKLGAVKNIKGGLVRWREEVDLSFPRY